MKVDREEHLLAGARYVPSPNADERPAGVATDLVVIHGISVPPNDYRGDGVERLFTNALETPDDETREDLRKLRRELAGLRVSAHLFIRRDGEIVQFVPFDKRAWHCGESRYRERDNCNDFSIGIELEGSDFEPYEEVQYERLPEVLRALMDAYPALSAERVVGHSDIAPVRKTDPGDFFDWERLAAAGFARARC